MEESIKLAYDNIDQANIHRRELEALRKAKEVEHLAKVDKDAPIPDKSYEINKLAKRIKWSKSSESVGAVLKNDKDEEVDAKEVLESFYGFLFAKKSTNDKAKERWLGKIEERVSLKDKQKLGEEIKREEIREAIENIKNGKAPGCDGLGIKIYKKIPFLGKWLLEAWLEAEKSRELWESARMAYVRVIYKKGDPLKIGNFRPISLCNVDYKIIAKVLAERMSDIMVGIMDDEQTGSVKGRDIRSNVAVIRAVLEKVRKEKGDGGVLLLDFEKAYVLTI